MKLLVFKYLYKLIFSGAKLGGYPFPRFILDSTNCELRSISIFFFVIKVSKWWFNKITGMKIMKETRKNINFLQNIILKKLDFTYLLFKKNRCKWVL